ncbi:MAG: cytochrome C oxidase subunit IV family protein [Actinomycetota bacterium]
MALEQREVEAPAEHAGTHGGHPSPKEYVRIGVILGVLTALEIGASYAGVSTGILIPTLFILAVVKFALVVMWFMHLRFDDRRYARFFVMGLAGASVLYLIVLISLRVFA